MKSERTGYHHSNCRTAYAYIFEWIGRVRIDHLLLRSCLVLGEAGGADLRLAAILLAIETVLFLDIVFNWRWILHGLLMRVAIEESVYRLRQGPQLIALAILLGLFLAACGLVLRRWRGRPGAVLALWGLLVSLALWVTEIVSLHPVDSVLYRRAGPIMCISFLWVAAALMTSVGILAEARRGKTLAERRERRGSISPAGPNRGT